MLRLVIGPLRMGSWLLGFLSVQTWVSGLPFPCLCFSICQWDVDDPSLSAG